MKKFRQGGEWDLQRLSGKFDSRYIDSATVLIGIYGAAAGIDKNTLLSIEDTYAMLWSRYPKSTVMDKNYTSLPARNVKNTDIGYEWYRRRQNSTKP